MNSQRTASVGHYHEFPMHCQRRPILGTPDALPALVFILMTLVLRWQIWLSNQKDWTFANAHLFADALADVAVRW